MVGNHARQSSRGRDAHQNTRQPCSRFGCQVSACVAQIPRTRVEIIAGSALHSSWKKHRQLCARHAPLVESNARATEASLACGGSIVRRFRGGARVLLAARHGRLNRDWLDVDALVQGLRRVPGVVGVSTGRLTLTRSQDQAAEHWEEGWFEQEPAGREMRADGGKVRRPREALMTLVGRLQNCSILIGVTGDALASALWMPPGTLVLQVFSSWMNVTLCMHR